MVNQNCRQGKRPISPSCRADSRERFYVAGGSNEVPQRTQNVAPGGTSFPQFGHLCPIAGVCGEAYGGVWGGPYCGCGVPYCGSAGPCCNAGGGAGTGVAEAPRASALTLTAISTVTTIA